MNPTMSLTGVWTAKFQNNQLYVVFTRVFVKEDHFHRNLRHW
jgi:hypothetical protein